MTPVEMENMAQRIAASALALERVPFGPWKGSMRAVSADQVPLDYATTGTDFLYQPRDGTFKRRGGQSIKFDSATGLLPAHWSAKARHADEYVNDQFTDGLPSVACLFTKETVASGLDDGRFSNFWFRDQINDANRTIGDEYSSTTYPVPGSTQSYRVVPLWYESGDGGITRGTFEFGRRFFFSGARRWLKAGNWTYFPSRLGTPSRQRYGFSTSSTSTLTADSDLDPTGPYIGWAPDATHYYSSLGGASTAGSHFTAFQSNDDASSYLAINEGAPNGTNPEKIGLNGSVLPGYTYTITCQVFTLSGTLGGGSNMTVSLVDTAGKEWISSPVSISGVGVPPSTSKQFTVTTSGSPNSTGNATNAIWLSASGAGSAYVCVSYFTVTGVSTSGQPNRLIPSGPIPPTHCGTIAVGDTINNEFSRPDADVSAGVFTPSTGATLFGVLDETVVDDSDFVSGASGSFTVGMSDFGTDPTTADDVNVHVRARIFGLGAMTMKIELLETATVRASQDQAITGSFASYTLSLTTTEISSVTNWDNARVRVSIVSGSAVLRVSYVSIERVPAAATAGGGWRGHDQFMRRIAYRFEDGSVWMPSTPRFPNTLLTSGLGLSTVDITNPDQAYSFLRWQNLPIPPHGVTDLVLMRSEKIDSSTEDVLTLNPFRMGVIAEVPAGTTTYDDYFADDDSLTFDPSELVIRYDHMMPPRARYNFAGAQRVCHQNGSTNPCAITLAPVGLAADYDRNLADDSSTVYGSGSQYFYIYNDPGASPTQGLVLVKKTSGGTVTSQTFTFASGGSYDTLQKLCDGINATVFSGNGGQWRAQLCPDVSGDVLSSSNLTPHKRTITSCVVSGQTITKAAGGLSAVAVGAKIYDAGVTGAYVSRIDSDTQLTFVGTVAAATKTLTFYFDTGDDVDGSLPWAQRVIANSLPGFAYFSMTWLNTEPIKKATTWMTTASPGSTKAAPNCFSALADNEHTPPLDAGIGMGGGAVDNGFVVAFSKKRGAIRNTRDSGSGVDSDYHLFITNEGSGCTAWNTVAQGDRCVFLMANEGVFVCDLFGEKLLSKHIHCHDPATGDFTFENPLGLLAAGGDTDGSYASARVVRGALWVCYRASGSTPNRVVVYPFTSGQETNGLRSMVREGGEPFGWSVPLVYGTSPVLVFQQAPRSSSESLHIYGMSDGNAGSTGDGRIDELETGTQDNSVDISASLELPWLRFSPDEQVSGQDMVIDHNSPSGSTGTMTFIRSFSATDTYALTPGTSSTLVVSSEPKFLPQAARVGANAVMLKWTQATGSSRTLRRVLLRVKRLKFFKGA